MMHKIAALASFIFLLIPATGKFQHIPSDKILHYNSAAQPACAGWQPSITVAIKNDTLVEAFFQALSYYPELQQQKICLRYGSIKTSMTASPRPFSVLFRKRSKRSYYITINKKPNSSAALLLHTAPFNAQVGVLGHELAHILDYTTKSGWQVMGFGVRYLGKGNRRKIERKTDSTAMIHGLTWQVYNFSYFVLNEAAIDDNYRKYKTDIYMSPTDSYRMATEIDSLQRLR